MAETSVASLHLTGSQLDFLISCLDEYRDYGKRTYEDVVREVRSGHLELFPAPADSPSLQPMIIDAVTHLYVKGTGAISASRGHAYTKQTERVKAKFAERFEQDFDRAYAALLQAVVIKLDPRAMKIYFEMGLGAPQKQIEGGMTTDAFNAAIAAIREARDSGSAPSKYIDATTGEPVDEHGRLLT